MRGVLREPEEPSFDEYIFCCGCGNYVYEYCSIHGPLLVVPDDKVPTPRGLPPLVPRAALTLPRALLHLAPSAAPGAGIGVFSSVTLPLGVRFGPYRGVKRHHADSAYCWQIFDRLRARSHVVDAADAARSNWLRYVNCARAQPNLAAFQYRGQVYYRTVRVIPPFTELLVFCGSECARAHEANLRNHAASTSSLPGPEATIENQKPTDDSGKTINLTANEPTDILNHTHYIKEEKEHNEPDGNDIQIISNNSEEASTKDECPQANVNVTENESYICDECGKAFQEKALLLPHIAAHNTLKYLITNNLKWVCAPCNAKFATKSELINHEIEDHGSKIKYKACTLCNYKTVDSYKLVRHIKTHNNEKPYACNICDTKLSSSDSLKRHVKSHIGEKSYQCAICNSKFNSCSSLKNHTRIHMSEKPYTCETCNLKFKRSNSLKRHVKTHNRPYQCQLCNLSFSLSSLLNRHIRTHTEAKPYVCTDCDSKFNNRTSLKRHSLIHTGVKPYNCTICNYKFRHTSTLKRHLRIHTDKNCIPVLPVTTKT